MNQREGRIEELLRGMPLAEPSAALDRRLLRRPAGRALWAVGLTAAAAAAVVAAVTFGRGVDAAPQPKKHIARESSTDPAAAPAAGEPVRYEQVYTDARYAGTYEVDTGPPVRAIRHVTVRRVWWVNQQRDLRMEMTVPDEEVVLVRADVN